MIDITKQICDLVDGIPGLSGHVFRAWPQKRLRETFAIVTRLTRQVETVDYDGSEVIVRVGYLIIICAPSVAEVDALEEKVADIMSTYNLHSSSAGPVLVDASNLYQTNITITGAVDRRGNTFS